ncbi:YkyB family protein [Bacillaceae bacterium S4-13-58]
METTEKIEQALFTLNRHSKTALDPTSLYQLKRQTIQVLIEQGKAEKVGLHFCPNPGFAKQRSNVLVRAGDYYFHHPATKEDFNQLPHLGHWDKNFRNPKVKMGLSVAKQICQNYLKENGKEVSKDKPRIVTTVYTSKQTHDEKVEKRTVDNRKRSICSWIEE